jgi:hypothetical protein
MSSIDCDLDVDTPLGLPNDQFSSIELARMIVCDEPEEPTEAKERDGFHEAANPSVTRNFCCPDRTTPLSSDEVAVLWERLRRNGYATCSIKAGSKKPFGREWQKNALMIGPLTPRALDLFAAASIKTVTPLPSPES